MDNHDILLWLPYNSNSEISHYFDGGFTLFWGDQFPDYKFYSSVLRILYPPKKYCIILRKTKIHGIIKSYLLCTILANNDIFSDDFKYRLSKILPRGINCSKVCTDKEYYRLKKEFKVQLEERFYCYNKKTLPKKNYINVSKIAKHCEKNQCDYSFYRFTCLKNGFLLHLENYLEKRKIRNIRYK